MPQLVAARDGSASLKIGEIFIHSPYSPEKEVKKFLDHQDLSRITTVLLCGETLGYLGREIRARYPGVKILSILYSADLAGVFPPELGKFWHPGRPGGLTAFLHDELPLADLAGAGYVAWPASGRAYPESSRKILAEIRQFFRENSGALGVARSFGRKSIRNLFANFLTVERLFFFPGLPRRPVFIAASGPTLTEALPLLEKIRREVFLVALPSSLEALLDRDLAPDLFIQTDPGYYAGFHFRKLRDRPVDTAMPLTAARGLGRTRSRVFVFSQGSFPENELAACLGGMTYLPPGGTVMASALAAALGSSVSGNPGPPVFCAGFDLCSRDVFLHVRPHSFDGVLEEGARRTRPVLTELYTRAAADSTVLPESTGPDSKAGPGRCHWQSFPMKTYAGWINRGGLAGQGLDTRSLYRLFPSPVDLAGFTPVSPGEAQALIGGFDAGCSPGASADPAAGTGQHPAAGTWRNPAAGTWQNPATFPEPRARRAMARGVTDRWIAETRAWEERIASAGAGEDDFFAAEISQGLFLNLAFLEFMDLKKDLAGGKGDFPSLARPFLENIREKIQELREDFRL